MRAQIYVKDGEKMETEIHFMPVKTRKDGKPVGIIVKRVEPAKKKTKNKTKKGITTNDDQQLADDSVPEIIGVRVPDDIRDRHNIYRNSQVVNNTLVVRKLLFSY